MLSQAQKDAKKSATSYFLGSGAVAASLGVSSISANMTRQRSKNICGIGIGPKITSGSIITNQDSVHVYVRSKFPKSQISPSQMVPPTFSSLPTDVIEIGDITLYHNTSDRFSKLRPTSCGVSVGHHAITAGTIGCLVTKGNKKYILSNNHVLANVNRGTIGDAIIQQGQIDGGSSPNDDIAILTDFKTIDTSGLANDIDAAIAEVTTPGNILPEIIDIGLPLKTPTTAKQYQSVRKHGRTTGHTIGVIMDLSADIWVRVIDEPGNIQDAWFEDQLGIIGIGGNDFSKGGDSGSLIVDAVSIEPVGLLFAGGGALTFANQIQDVLKYFGVRIVGK